MITSVIPLHCRNYREYAALWNDVYSRPIVSMCGFMALFRAIEELDKKFL